MSYGSDRFKSSWDMIFYAVKEKKLKVHKNVSITSLLEFGRGMDVIISPQPRPLLHKAQKPLDVIMRFIVCCSEEGDLVLDPFIGVGTTLIASKFLKRRFLGFEQSEKDVETARKRLECKDLLSLKKLDMELWRKLKFEKDENKK